MRAVTYRGKEQTAAGSTRCFTDIFANVPGDWPKATLHMSSVKRPITKANRRSDFWFHLDTFGGLPGKRFMERFLEQLYWLLERSQGGFMGEGQGLRGDYWG